MPAPRNCLPEFDAGGGRSVARRRWRTRISREQERHLYFLATVGAAVWYLMTRVF